LRRPARRVVWSCKMFLSLVVKRPVICFWSSADGIFLFFVWSFSSSSSFFFLLLLLLLLHHLLPLLLLLPGTLRPPLIHVAPALQASTRIRIPTRPTPASSARADGTTRRPPTATRAKSVTLECIRTRITRAAAKSVPVVGTLEPLQFQWRRASK